MTLRSHQKQGSLTPWPPHIDMLGMPPRCTTLGNSTWFKATTKTKTHQTIIWKTKTLKDNKDATLFWKTHLLKLIHRAGMYDWEKTISSLALGKDRKDWNTVVRYLEQTQKQPVRFYTNSGSNISFQVQERLNRIRVGAAFPPPT